MRSPRHSPSTAHPDSCPVAGCLGNVKVAFSTPSRKVSGAFVTPPPATVARLCKGSPFAGEASLLNCRENLAGASHCRLNTPAESFGVFKRPLHLFSQDFLEDRSTHDPRVWLGE